MDQFFTKPEISMRCVKDVLSLLGDENIPIKQLLFIEPSAGNGCFLDNLNEQGLKFQAYDIEPRRDSITNRDFLTQEIAINKPKAKTIIIGNPPFGKAGKMAFNFIIQGFYYSDFVCFILPNNFQKYSMQRLLPDDVRIIYQKELPRYSFYTDECQDVDIGCVFQVLTRRKTKRRDKRIKTKPPIEHSDFILYQYNNTKGALKYFECDFDIAIFNQGYGKYPDFKTNADECDKKKQWLLVKCKNVTVLNRVKKMDFAKLANRNTTVKGFRKADFVGEYNKLYG